jgi:uncharacterized membrane protein YbjE (DUF340 family)
MTDSTERAGRGLRVLLWCARITGGIFVATLAFRWKLAGGVLALACSFGWWAYVGFTLRILPIAVMVGIPGVLYVVYGLLSRKGEQAAPTADEVL